MTVVWGQKAYDDLDGIVDYLADLSPEAVEKTINRIQNMRAIFHTSQRRFLRID
jgi:plasmid stabilization system protein ParE